MSLLSVSGLTKKYPSFTLDGVSFEIGAGEIVGFIGRNGAGKSTTLKSLMGFVHPDGGEVRLFGQPFAGESGLKRRIGFVPGGIDYYPKAKLSAITAVTRRFYESWDEGAYLRCLSDFSLDEKKTPSELSEGMKVKYALTLALSIRAELLILDEPTSGLDPVSRDELLDIFLKLREEGIGILFSTHIISDLERCADRIIYIREGRIYADLPLPEFERSYRLVRYAERPEFADRLIGERRERDGFTALIKAEDSFGIISEPASPEEIMLHLERKA